MERYSRQSRSNAAEDAKADLERIRKEADDTRHLLDEIVTYVRDMQPASAGVIDGPRPAPGSRVLIDVNRWDLTSSEGVDVGADLWNWVTLVIDEMVDLDEDELVETAPSSRHPTIADACQFLSAHAAWIITYNDDFPKAIRTIHRTYRRAAGIRLEAVYRCPRCTWRVEPMDGQTWYRCTGCGNTWTMAAEIDRLMRRQDSVMTLGEIAREIGVPHSTLRKWAGKRFSQVGMRHGRPLYDIRTVQRAAERIRDTA